MGDQHDTDIDPTDRCKPDHAAGVAMAADYMAADANQDGMLSYEEVQAILPEVTTDTFMAVDADGDGLINADELAMAQTEGLMPEADS